MKGKKRYVECIKDYICNDKTFCIAKKIYEFHKRNPLEYGIRSTYYEVISDYNTLLLFEDVKRFNEHFKIIWL